MIQLTDRELQKLKLNKKVVSQIKNAGTVKKPAKQAASDDKTTSALTEAIKLLVKSINLDISMKSLKNNDNNNRPLIETIKSLQKTQDKLGQVITPNKKEKQKWEFTVERTSNGFINKIIAKEI